MRALESRAARALMTRNEGAGGTSELELFFFFFSRLRRGRGVARGRRDASVEQELAARRRDINGDFAFLLHSQAQAASVSVSRASVPPQDEKELALSHLDTGEASTGTRPLHDTARFSSRVVSRVANGEQLADFSQSSRKRSWTTDTMYALCPSA